MKTRTLKKVGVGTNYSLPDIVRDKLQAWIILRSDPIKSYIRACPKSNGAVPGCPLLW